MRSRLLFLLLAASLFLLPFGESKAAQANLVAANHAWIRLLPGDLPASGYVTLQNNGSAVATLVSAHSKTYASVMLHQSTQEADGMSRMAMIAQLTIPANGQISLAPANYHLMLQQASHPVKAGDYVDITLDFSDGSQLPLRFLVRPANTVDAN